MAVNLRNFNFNFNSRNTQNLQNGRSATLNKEDALFPDKKTLGTNVDGLCCPPGRSPNTKKGEMERIIGDDYYIVRWNDAKKQYDIVYHMNLKTGKCTVDVK